MTLLDRFLRTAETFPDAVALEVAGRELTYGQLNEASARIAAMIDNRSDGQRPVALAVSRDPVTYAAYLAILRCGVPVVPFDPQQPVERNLRALMLAGVCLAVTAGVPEAADEAVPTLVVTEEAAQDARPWHGPRSAASEIAYVLFTSGSTGIPKGIPIRHRQLDAFLTHNIARYGAGPGSRMSQTFGLTFDPSVFDMFVAWGSGATLVVPSREQMLDPVRFVNDKRITHWYSVPSLISVAQGTGSLVAGSMPSLSWSLFAGEQLTLEQARLWARAAPHSTLENLYGPTELAVTVSAYRLPADPLSWPETSNATAPIGSVYPHLDHRVDPAGGELLVRGPQRFDGYLDPADNVGRFHVDVDVDALPPSSPVPEEYWYRTGDRVAVENGELVHLGRLDQQVKIAGQRIELGDVESAIRRHCGIEEVVVVPTHGPVPLLTAVYAGPQASAGELRARLRGHLPTHMIPKRFVACAALPLNSNGKVDRAACAAI